MSDDDATCSMKGCDRPRKTRGLCQTCYQFARRYGWLSEVTADKRHEDYVGPTYVYRLFDADDVLLYVGATQNVKQRLAKHRLTQPWWSQVARHTVEAHSTRSAALDAEHAVIRTERPVHNIVGSIVCGCCDEHPEWGDRLTCGCHPEYMRDQAVSA